MSKYARKTDGNHTLFSQAFTKAGLQFKDTHCFPGMLDYIVRSRRGHLIWFEVKIDENEPLTEAEKKTFAMFPTQCFRVWEPQQAIDIVYESDNGGEE